MAKTWLAALASRKIAAPPLSLAFTAYNISYPIVLVLPSSFRGYPGYELRMVDTCPRTSLNWASLRAFGTEAEPNWRADVRSTHEDQVQYATNQQYYQVFRARNYPPYTEGPKYEGVENSGAYPGSPQNVNKSSIGTALYNLDANAIETYGDLALRSPGYEGLLADPGTTACTR